MTLKARRILFIFFVIIFLVVTPLVSLYAAGYKINLSWPPKFKQALQKTGILILDTEPEGAKIYLDNKPRQLFFKKYYNKEQSYVKTPAKIKNLLPGEYNIKLELDGYWPWEKKLIVKPGQSTYAEDVYLFKKNLPAQIINIIPGNNLFSKIPIRIIKPSPNKKYFFILNEEKLIILNINGEKIEEILLASLASQIKPNSPVLWSPDNKKILVEKILFNLDEFDKPIYLDKLISLNINNFKWDGNNPAKLYYQRADSINYFDLNSGLTEKIISGENYIDYLVNNDYIFYISQIGKLTSLKSINLKNKELIREIELPYSPQYKIINPGHTLINLYDEKHQILYLIDPLSAINPIKEIINNIKYTYWIDNKLLYANDFEIWLFDINYNKKTILTRISQPITNILWHPSNNYVIYLTEKTINIIELDEREKRNITELIKFDKIYYPSLNQKGDVLYFGAKISNQEGLYKLEIQ